MALRKPRNLAGGGGDMDVLQYEILQEKAAVLARLGRKLQAALDRLAAFDAAAHRGSGRRSGTRWSRQPARRCGTS